MLFDGQIVLVCDVGGGTSDFSLIRVSREGDLVNFTRTAVGKHLLLGGDNLDLTLAWLVETKLGVPLSIRQRSGLRRQCSAAKEKLLNDPNLKSVEITVLGAGSSLIGKSLKTEILREEALELALEGFLPISERGELPKEEKRSLFRELGLPYVSDPAITRHLNAFLEADRPGARRHPLQRRLLHPRDSAASASPMWWRTGTAGVRRSSRIAISIWPWRAARPTTPTCAPPAAACWCAAACRARTTSASANRTTANSPPSAWCRAAPKKASALEIDNDALQLVANRPVSFRLFSSLTRTDDKLGRGGRVRRRPIPTCTCTRRSTP